MQTSPLPNPTSNTLLPNIPHVPVCIVGAGPGGCATALQLHQHQIPCLLLDKSTFPRDKICGDGLSGKVTTILGRINPEIMERFAQYSAKLPSWGIKFVSPNGIGIDVPFKYSYEKEKDPIPGFVAKRMDFDHFLITEVQRCASIDLRLGVAIETYEQLPNGDWLLKDAQETPYATCTLLIVANGAHSSFARHHAHIKMEPEHHAAAIRAYYKGVADMHPDGFIELHFVKEFLPGYFWIFPLANGEANVGVGMLTASISKHKINLKERMLELIATHPEFKRRFAQATPISKIQGYGLPLGSKRRVLSGNHYMLVGDAASLIDPLTGEGIGHAIYSGLIAADQAKACIASGNFSAETMKAYDTRVYRVLGAELQLSHRFQQLLAYPWLFSVVASLMSRNKRLAQVMSAMFNDIDLRKQITNPMFYIRMLLNR